MLGCFQALFLLILIITLSGRFHSPHFSEKETEIEKLFCFVFKSKQNKNLSPGALADKTQSKGTQPLLLLKANRCSGDSTGNMTVLTSSPSLSLRKWGDVPVVLPG